MKRFRFRLQTLLDQRQAAEDLLLAELGELRREEEVELARLGGLEVRLKEAWAMVEGVLTSKGHSVTGSAIRSFASSDVSVLDEYAKALRDDIVVQRLTIAGVRERVEAKRIELTEAMKQRKVIEALRDKQEQAYIAAGMRAEQNSLDEMSSLRYARGM